MTHTFANQETLDRARYWLPRFGFTPDRIEVHNEGAPAISLTAPLPDLAEAELLFAALEASEPNGRPGFWHSAPAVHAAPTATEVAFASGPHTGMVLSWHSPDQDLLSEPELRAICEAMDR